MHLDGLGVGVVDQYLARDKGAGARAVLLGEEQVPDLEHQPSVVCA